MGRINIKLLLIYIFTFILLFNVNNVYSRYVSTSENAININVSSWNILVNNTDITSSNSTNVVINPVINNNNNVQNNLFAPGTTGYFDIYIDCSNVTTSFSYEVDTKFIDYEDYENIGVYEIETFLHDEYSTASKISRNSNFVEGKFSGVKKWDGNQIENFYIRVYFGWKSVDNILSNEKDNQIGSVNSYGNADDINISVNLSFKQYVD